MESVTTSAGTCNTNLINEVSQMVEPDESDPALPNVELDIKPSISQLPEHYDDGVKTPPLPRSVKVQHHESPHPYRFPPSSYKTPEQNESIRVPPPVRSAEYGPSYSPIDPNSPEGFLSLRSDCHSSDRMNREVDTMTAIAMGRIRCLEKTLDESRFNLQVQKSKGISAVRMLNAGLTVLQRNIQEMMGLVGLDLEDSEGRISSSSAPVSSQHSQCSCVLAEKQAQQTQTDTLIPENSGTETAVVNSEIYGLGEKLTFLDRSTKDAFKILEGRRMAMLVEIKKTNEALSRLLAQQDDLILDHADLEHEVILPVQDLNLQQDWTEADNEGFKDLEDYEYDVQTFQTHVNLSLEQRNSEMSIYCTPVKNRNKMGRKTLSAKSSNFSDESMSESPALGLSTSTDNIHQRDENSPKILCKCGADFKNNGALWSHVIYNNPPRLKCDHCDNLFRKNGELMSHLTQEHNITAVERFRCYKCNQSFMSRSEVSKHRGICPLLPAKPVTASAKKARTTILDSDSSSNGT